MRANKMESACQQFSPESPSLSFPHIFTWGMNAATCLCGN